VVVKRAVLARKVSHPAAAPLPAFRPFQLAKLVANVPTGDGWLFEMKYDGYRCQAAIRGTEVQLYSRGGHDWSKQFEYVAPALATLQPSAAAMSRAAGRQGHGLMWGFIGCPHPRSRRCRR
jgi:bifunctional non-homologous end joining protein LigD